MEPRTHDGINQTKKAKTMAATLETPTRPDTTTRPAPLRLVLVGVLLAELLGLTDDDAGFEVMEEAADDPLGWEAPVEDAPAD